MTTKPQDLTLRRADQRDWLYIKARIELSRHAFGFWPEVWLRDAFTNGRIKIGDVNNDPATIFIHGAASYTTRVFVAFTEQDARLNDFCRINFLHLLANDLHPDCERITLRSAEDLPCNLVWPRLGLTLASRTAARTATSRPLNHWRLVLPRGAELERFLDEQTADPKRKQLLKLFGMEESFRASLTTRYRKRGAK